MAKMLHCDDVIPGCPTVIEGEDAFEVATRAREHAKTAHRLPFLTASLTGLLHRAIQDKPPDRPSRA